MSNLSEGFATFRQQFAEHAQDFFDRAGAAVTEQLTSGQFYADRGAVLIVARLAWSFSALLKRTPIFREPKSGSFEAFRRGLYRLSFTLFPLILSLGLAIAVRWLEVDDQKRWVLRTAEGVALVYLLFQLINRYLSNGFVRAIARWYGLPVAALAAFGWLDDVTLFLQGLSVQLGNITISLYGVMRTFVFGTILFWLGRVSNSRGKEVIRRQEQLDLGTREVFVKLFEISLFVLIFLLLLNLLGVNLTALAVFGGALGVGLGFGLQQIASNFISGIIILLDRSLTIGDFVELEDGRSGTVRELNMRFAVVETYDGKDVVVPNEQFITTTYTNWTHKDPNQRCSIEIQVAYSTDLDALFDDLRSIVSAHPQVLSGDEHPFEFQPDAEIAGFGDSGIDVLIEYWMEGIDDGKNRVEADLILSIYHLFRDKGYQFPFPQREVRVLGQPTS